MSKAVQQLFTSIAPRYDFLNHFLSFSIDKRWRNKTIVALGKQTEGPILDLCAGTLDITKLLAEKFPRAEIYAVDFSLAMLKAGEFKVGGNSRVRLICADGHRLPFPNQSLEAVLCAFGIRNLESREQAAGEIRRVLKRRGKLIVLEFFRPKKFWPRLFYQSYGRHILPRIGGIVSKNRNAYQYLQDSIQNFLSVEEYQKLLKKSGFKNFQILPLSGGIAHRVVAE